MRKTKQLSFVVIAMSLALTAGCNSEATNDDMPEVTEENCQLEVIKKIEDQKTREVFSGKCMRRTPETSVGTTENKEW